MGPAIRVVVLATAVLVSSCGEQGAVTTSALTASCPLATGTYVSEATMRSMGGTCPRAKEHTRDRLEFDEGGFISPAAVFIPCTTEQDQCSLTVTCQVLDLKMVFAGELVDDATRIVGVATFSGEGDCKSVVYDVDAARPVP